MPGWNISVGQISVRVSVIGHGGCYPSATRCFSGDKMYLKLANGAELEARIVKRVG
jgi:hypothetical protein